MPVNGCGGCVRYVHTPRRCRAAPDARREREEDAGDESQSSHVLTEVLDTVAQFPVRCEFNMNAVLLQHIQSGKLSVGDESNVRPLRLTVRAPCSCRRLTRVLPPLGQVARALFFPATI